MHVLYQEELLNLLVQRTRKVLKGISVSQTSSRLKLLQGQDFDFALHA